jgi:hypothetical protein
MALANGSIDEWDGYGFMTDEFGTLILGFSIYDAGMDYQRGEYASGNFEYDRYVWVPATGSYDYARYADTVTNITGADLAFTFSIAGDLGSDSSTAIFDGAEGTNLLCTSDGGFGDNPLCHVGGSDESGVVVDLLDDDYYDPYGYTPYTDPYAYDPYGSPYDPYGSPYDPYGYGGPALSDYVTMAVTVVIPAGESRTMVWFEGQDADDSVMSSFAANLLSGALPDAFTGLGDYNVINWDLAPSLSLETSGSCPGTTNIDLSGVSAGGPVVFISSAATGDAALPLGPCAGVSTGLALPLMYFRTTDADGDGAISLSPSLGERACGRVLQALDTTTCTVSAVAPL